MKHFWKSGLKKQIWKKLEFVGAIKRTSARAPKARIERACVHAHKRMINRSAIERTNCDRAHLCLKPTPAAAIFWKFCFIRVLLILVAQGFNPKIFRVSRILLDYINRHVNTLKKKKKNT
jgi:hypothetical protein